MANYRGRCRVRHPPRCFARRGSALRCGSRLGWYRERGGCHRSGGHHCRWQRIRLLVASRRVGLGSLFSLECRWVAARLPSHRRRGALEYARRVSVVGSSRPPRCSCLGPGRVLKSGQWDRVCPFTVVGCCQLAALSFATRRSSRVDDFERGGSAVHDR